jgi:uncharacterized damage-inducible protein DinB
MNPVEPWMRGPIEGLPPVVSHLLYTFQQAREELAHHTRDVLPEQLWMRPAPKLAPLGFHLKHIAGSVDRLATYLAGRLLSDSQLAILRSENVEGSETLPELLENLSETFARVEAQVRAIGPDQYLEVRGVGRKALPTTVAGLIIHISEHTQRHLGQAVLTAKLLSPA